MAKLINKKLIESSNDFSELIDAIEDSYGKLGKGKIEVSSRTFVQTKDGGFFVIGAALNRNNEDYIVMNLPVMPWHQGKELPVALSNYIYSSFRTGEIKAIVGGADIVKYRTPAKSALVAKHLAIKKAEYTLGLIGLGSQAAPHVEAISSVLNITKVLGNSRNPEKWGSTFEETKEKTGLDIEIVTRKDLLADSDIVVVITSAKETLVEFDKLHKGQLVIGTDHAETVGKSVALKSDKVFVDYRPTAENEFAVVKALLDEGKKYEDIVNGNLSQLALGEVKGRENDDEIIFFQSLGVMNENLAAVEYFYNKIKDKAEEVEL